jgi:hypothetical protein
MEPQTRKWLQLTLLIFLALAAIRFALIYRSRHQPGPTARQERLNSQLNPDYYVVPRKLRPYNLESARQVTKQPVWVKEGYKYTYYPYDTARKRANFDQEAGTLGPIEKIQIKDLVQQKGPPPPPQVFTGAEGQPIKVRQAPLDLLLAVFEKDGKEFVVPIGSVKSGNYSIYFDEIFYIQDPHDLYKHWTADVWQSIDRHEIKPGMNEIQAVFAVGMGTPEPPKGDPSEKIVHYPNGGKPLAVTYRDGKAEKITEITPTSGLGG